VSANADISKFLAGMKRAGAETRRRGLRAMDLVGLQVLSQAQDKCPIATGFLQNSATDTPAEFDGNTVTKVIGFSAEYAAAVHENLNASFNTDANPNAQAKFLESEIRVWKDGKFPRYLADSIREGA
jgi:hypothetical protein